MRKKEKIPWYPAGITEKNDNERVDVSKNEMPAPIWHKQTWGTSYLQGDAAKKMSLKVLLPWSYGGTLVTLSKTLLLNHKHTCLRLMAAICTKKRLKQHDLSILMKKINPRNFVLGKFESDFLIFV
jgi:hypothetical protein